jgi:predicted nuclease of predicted toxin-antitoxin system
MKFKIDENLPIDLADFLIKEGYDAITVLDHDLVK